MGNYTREEILQMAEEEDVEFIRLQFTDMFGTLKNIAITARELFPAVVSMGELQKCQDPVLSTYPVQILLRFLR